MPGTPFGYGNGSFYDSQSYLYTTTPTSGFSTINSANSTQCSGNSYYEVPTNVIDSFFTNDPYNTIFLTTAGGVGCPIGTSQLLTAMKPNFKTAGAGTYAATLLGTQGAPAANSRILLCGNANLTQVVPAENCNSSSPGANIEQFSVRLAEYESPLVAVNSFYVNSSSVPPTWPNNTLCYTAFTFSTNGPLTIPTVANFIKMTNPSTGIVKMCQVVTGSPITSNYPTQTIGSQYTEPIPLDFTNTTSWISTSTFSSFTIWLWGPYDQRGFFGYLNDACILQYM
jgi:hypothetical protein